MHTAYQGHSPRGRDLWGGVHLNWTTAISLIGCSRILLWMVTYNGFAFLMLEICHVLIFFMAVVYSVFIG